MHDEAPSALNIPRRVAGSTATRTLAVILIVLLVPLAGCIGSSGSGGSDGGPAANGSSGGGPTGGLPASDGSSNQTQHAHDRWKGDTKKVLLDTTFTSEERTAVQPGEPAIDTFSRAVQGPSEIRFRLPQGKIVPPGTDHLEINASWQTSELPQMSQGGHTRPGRIAYRSAAGPPMELTSEKLSPANWTINTTIEMEDDGHAEASVWAFEFEIDSEARADNAYISTPQLTKDQMKLDVEIVAYRQEGPLPEEPSHPDWWAGDGIHPILSDSGEAEAAGAWFWQWGANTSRDFPLQWYPAGGYANGTQHDIIPPGTSVLVARLNWTNESPTSGTAGVQPWLQWNNAGTFAWNDWEPATSGSGEAVYTVAIEDEDTDGMYAGTSRWRFRWGFFGEDTGEDDPVFGSQLRQPYHYKGSWELSIDAYEAASAAGNATR